MQDDKSFGVMMSSRREVLYALSTPFALHGAVPAGSTGDVFRDFVVRDIEQNRKAIRVAGVQPE